MGKQNLLKAINLPFVKKNLNLHCRKVIQGRYRMKKSNSSIAIALCIAAASFIAFSAHAENPSFCVDFGKSAGRIKPLHGVNNAPMRYDARGGKQKEFKDAGIPFMRTHDTYGAWGGGHFIDIPNIFPDFDADETDPKNYDFAFTDEYLKPIVNAGCRIYYRLGATIENNYRIKAYNIYPPKDFAKWARICEHVIRHYNEGWANGHHWNIEYWEIWNEPENPPMWFGTREQFYELYRVAANHLKNKFPKIKIGGYASCGFYTTDDPNKRGNKLYATFVPWFKDFLAYIKNPATKAPMDFFSWHIYVYAGTEIERIIRHADFARKELDAAGFADVESHLNEWNVFIPQYKNMTRFEIIKEPPCAARVLGAMTLMQRSRAVDAAMYYDACPTRAYCGLFYFPSLRTTPTYEAFRAFNVLYSLGEAAESSVGGAGLYALAAKDATDKAFVIANTGPTDSTIIPSANGCDGIKFTVRRLSETHRHLEIDGTWQAGEKLFIPSDTFVLVSTRSPEKSAEIIYTTRPLNGIDDGN